MQEPNDSVRRHLRGQSKPSHDPEGHLVEGTGIAEASTTPRPPPPQLSTLETTSKKKKKKKCRYFFGNGCKAGPACPFSHDALASTPIEGTDLLRVHDQGSSSHAATVPVQRTPKLTHEKNQDAGIREVDEQVVSTRQRPPGTKMRVPTPVSEAQRTDPRQFQLDQVRRRFSPDENEEDSATILSFRLKPTDPDFPFEITDLCCTLCVPHGYPNKGRPSLRVTNPEMERGYQINVERGFDSLVAERPQSRLLAILNELDKRLERLLMSEKAPTLKLMANAGQTLLMPQRHLAVPAPDSSVPSTPQSSLPSTESQHTLQQIANARTKRESDIRQLEARLGRQHLFSKSSDGLQFCVPLHVSKAGKLPPSLESFKSVDLFVPQLYNLEPCTISLGRDSSELTGVVQAAFERHARRHPEMTLMAHINHLAQNMHTMAVDVSSRTPAPAPEILSLPSKPFDQIGLHGLKDPAVDILQDRPHVQIIPRPPEWDTVRDGAGLTTFSDASDSGLESDSETEDDDGGAAVPTEAQVPQDMGSQVGISLSFPSLELYGIELLQLCSVSLTVKCDRCKEAKDVKNIKAVGQGESLVIKQESCSKCANQLGIGCRSEPMHSHSVRAGHLDLDGCTIMDLLPSNFIPTCSQCSTSQPPPGVVSFRGESIMTMCRECHQRMNFKIPDVKFLRVSVADRTKYQPLPRKRPKENLGIVSGQELPRRGRCEHYAKSFRWFRFSCCSKVYPCDRCHDVAEEHPNEHANRMICGFCSREQIYRPEDCIHCRASLIRKHGGGFWEGGKGTRDKARMSRKDPRKYKRRPGGTVGGGGKK